ncbi:MAG: TonB-dependent receptor [Salinivirgaceae bacterium]|jgi:outer membrane cobalamin receptor|nr:TonB-dependent receptor [Salinivirgaceae bacterium]
MKKLFLLITASLISIFAVAQTGSVKGFVYDKDTGEPIIFTNVFLEGTSHGVATDVNGVYVISRVPEGDYTLVIKYMGYETFEEKVHITGGDVLSKNIFLEPSSIKIDDIVVSAERQEMQQEVHTAVVKVTPRQIQKLPSVGGEVDIAQYIQVVPGVVFTGDQGGQLYIRGGAPIHNKVLLDGMTIYNPFHSIGMFSVFDSDLLQTADVYTGGFNAEYGGRISSIMDIRTRQGNKKRFAGKITTNTFASKLLVEGPIKKFEENSPNSITYALSMKRAYLEQTSKEIYSYANEDGLPFNFADLYGKVAITGKSGNKIDLFGFNFNDNVNYQGVTDLQWQNSGGGANAIVVPSQSNSIIDFHASFSDYNISMETAEASPSESSIRDFGFGLSVKSFIGKNELSFGFDFASFATNYSFHNAYGLGISHSQNTAEYSAFSRFKGSWGKLLVEPGLRLTYYASLGEVQLEPRLGMKYKIADNVRFKASGGFYSQNLIAANSQRSVVDLFYGFLSSPESMPDEFKGNEVETSLQKAKHVVAGVEYDLNNQITFNLEGYYKLMKPLININPNKQFAENTTFDVPDLLKTKYMIEEGDAYGIDISMKYDYKNWYIWTVGSYGFVNRGGYFFNPVSQKSEFIEYSPHFDRRISTNVVLSYTFGRDLNWETGLRWNYGSGLPFTSSKANYESLSLNSLSDDYSSTAGNVAIIYGENNDLRLTAYHRLDFNIKRKFYFGNNSEFEIIGSLTNVYDRKNVFYVTRLEGDIIYQLPILPSFGMTLTF